MATLADLQAFATSQANLYNVPPQILQWQLGQESGWRSDARNGNAVGIGQFMPGTAKQFGIDPTDPYQSITAAAKYDSQLYAQTGDWTSALTKYGTLANVPQSVTNSFNNMMAGIGLPTSTAPTPESTGTSATSDSFVTKIAVILLGIVVIAAGLFLLGKNAVKI